MSSSLCCTKACEAAALEAPVGMNVVTPGPHITGSQSLSPPEICRLPEVTCPLSDSLAISFPIVGAVCMQPLLEDTHWYDDCMWQRTSLMSPKEVGPDCIRSDSYDVQTLLGSCSTLGQTPRLMLPAALPKCVIRNQTHPSFRSRMLMALEPFRPGRLDRCARISALFSLNNILVPSPDWNHATPRQESIVKLSLNIGSEHTLASARCSHKTVAVFSYYCILGSKSQPLRQGNNIRHADEVAASRGIQDGHTINSECFLS